MPAAFALPVYARLTIALMDRLAANDQTRASLILQKMSAIWPDMASAFASEVQASGGVPSGVTWPSSIPSAWTGNTMIIGAVSIQRQTTQGSALYNAADALYDATGPQLPTAAQAVLNAIPANAQGREYVSRVASASPASIPSILDGLITSTIALSAVPSDTSGATSSTGGATQTSAPIPPRPSSPGPLTLPGMTITGSAPVAQRSNWGWWALGGAIAVGLMVYAYQRIES